MSMNPTGTSGDDYLVMIDDSFPYIRGNGGNDTIIGGAANDTLAGNSGDDIMDGRGGNNTYDIYPNEGSDIILSSDAFAYDEIFYKDGIGADDLSFSRVGNDLVISIIGTPDKVTIKNQLDPNSPSPIIDRIRFETGDEPIYLSNTAPVTNGRGALLVGSAGSDYLETWNGNDIISGDFYTKDLYRPSDVLTNLPTQFIGGDDTLLSGLGDDQLYGDLSGFYNIPQAATLVGGDDTLGNQGYAVRSVGDFLITTGASTAPVNLEGGDDSIIGGALGGRFYGDYYAQLQNPSNNPQDPFQLRGGNDEFLLGDTSIEGWANNTAWGDGYVEVNGGSAILAGGSDTVYGAAGDDRVYGDTEVFALQGATINDVAGNDLIMGGGGNDYLFGDGLYNADFEMSTFNIQAGDDTILGGDGDDTIYGDIFAAGTFSSGLGNVVRMGNDSLTGGTGNDTIYGDAYAYTEDDALIVGGNDTLTGGVGNDTLLGGRGNDDYHFSLGDGQDFIQEGRSSTFSPTVPGINWGEDRIIFGPGINSTDVTYSTMGSNLVISINGTTDQVVIENQLNGLKTFQQVEQLVFSDGVTVALPSIAQQFNDASPSISGSEGDDYIRASGTYQRVQGMGGNDYIIGNSLGDTLDGGAGHDTIDAGTGNDTLIGGTGNDQFIVNSTGVTVLENAGEGTDTAHLGYNKDSVTFRSQGADLIASVNNVDLLTIKDQLSANGSRVEVFRFADGTSLTAAAIKAALPPEVPPTPPGVLLNGTTNKDTLTGGAGNDTLNGKAGNDILNGGGGNDKLDTGAGNDYAYGEAGNDTIIGYTGNDVLSGGEGDDSLDGGDGLDILSGNEGKDILYGRLGNDALFGGDGNDYLDGGEDNDILSGDDGNDTLVGYSGVDMLSGGKGDDSLDGGSGIDALSGDDGNDTLYGRTGSDILMGGLGDDYLDGGEDDDALSGGDGNDQLFGYSGNDTLVGGTGDDLLKGESGNDTYLFSRGDGKDVVSDSSGTDKVWLDGSISKSSVALFRGATGDLQIGYAGSPEDRITISNGTAIERIQLNDGNYLSNADVNQLIQAMAAYANDHSISLTSLGDVQQDANLMAMINGAWRA